VERELEKELKRILEHYGIAHLEPKAL